MHWKSCACGDKSEEAAHTAGDWIVDVDATETAVGSKHTECTICGYTLEEYLPSVEKCLEEQRQKTSIREMLKEKKSKIHAQSERADKGSNKETENVS